MATLSEILEPRSDRERLLIATARFGAFTEVGNLLFNRGQELPTAASKHIAKLRNEVDDMAEKEAPVMRTLTWSEFQKENR